MMAEPPLYLRIVPCSTRVGFGGLLRKSFSYIWFEKSIKKWRKKIEKL